MNEPTEPTDLATVDQLREALNSARSIAKSARLDKRTWSPSERMWFGLVEDEVNYALNAVSRLDAIQARLF